MADGKREKALLCAPSPYRTALFGLSREATAAPLSLGAGAPNEIVVRDERTAFAAERPLSYAARFGLKGPDALVVMATPCPPARGAIVAPVAPEATGCEDGVRRRCRPDVCAPAGATVCPRARGKCRAVRGVGRAKARPFVRGDRPRDCWAPPAPSRVAAGDVTLIGDARLHHEHRAAMRAPGAAADCHVRREWSGTLLHVKRCRTQGAERARAIAPGAFCTLASRCAPMSDRDATRWGHVPLAEREAHIAEISAMWAAKPCRAVAGAVGNKCVRLSGGRTMSEGRGRPCGARMAPRRFVEGACRPDDGRRVV